MLCLSIQFRIFFKNATIFEYVSYYQYILVFVLIASLYVSSYDKTNYSYKKTLLYQILSLSHSNESYGSTERIKIFGRMWCSKCITLLMNIPSSTWRKKSYDIFFSYICETVSRVVSQKFLSCSDYS